MKKIFLTLCLSLSIHSSYSSDFKNCGEAKPLLSEEFESAMPIFTKDASRVVFVDFSYNFPSDGREFVHSSSKLDGSDYRFEATADWTQVYYSHQDSLYQGVCTKKVCVSRGTDNYKSNGRNVIVVTDANTRKSNLISLGEGNHGFPTITPDSKKIIFPYNSRNQDDSFDLMIVNIDGSNPQVLVPGEENDQHNWNPKVSPDGKYVAFTNRGAYGRDSYYSERVLLKCLK